MTNRIEKIEIQRMDYKKEPFYLVAVQKERRSDLYFCSTLEKAFLRVGQAFEEDEAQ
jgi:hypothetical protein